MARGNVYTHMAVSPKSYKGLTKVPFVFEKVCCNIKPFQKIAWVHEMTVIV